MTLLFDIGGTHMRIALALEDGIGPVVEHATPQNPREAARVVKQSAAAFPIPYDHALGGVAGSVLPNGILHEAGNLREWNGCDIQTIFEAELAVPVTLYNDAQLNALGEATHGAGVGAVRMAYLGFGTGIGTCVIDHGVIVEGTSGGEGRKNVMRLADGRLLDSLISGGAIKAHYGKNARGLTRSEWNRFTPLAAEGIENAIQAWQPDRVVVGGSLVNDEDGLRISELRALLPEPHQHLLVVGRFKDTSGLWGGWEKAV